MPEARDTIEVFEPVVLLLPGVYEFCRGDELEADLVTPTKNQPEIVKSNSAPVGNRDHTAADSAIRLVENVDLPEFHVSFNAQNIANHTDGCLKQRLVAGHKIARQDTDFLVAFGVSQGHHEQAGSSVSGS